MAPIQNKSSSSSSSYTHKSTSSHEDASSPRRTARDFTSDWESSFLPVTRRGRFFQDSFFENTRSHFDDAIRDALSKWGDDDDFLTDSWHDTTSPRHSNLSRYRQMRSRQVDDDNLAVTVTSDNNVHKIVIDVHDFVEGDLKVKVVGERELLVEGKKEKSKDGGASSMSSKNFSRRFNLPQDTDISAIDSVMSSDGILTITAPKVGSIGKNRFQRESSTSSTASTKKLQDEREPCDCDKCYPKLNTREHCKQKTSSAERSQSRFSDDISREQSEQRDRGMNTYGQEEKKNYSSSASSSADGSRFADKMEIPMRAFFNSRPITRRGRFFDDAFFADTRSGYRSAIQDVLSRWGEDRSSSATDDMASYRNLRTRDLRDDNQAVRTIEDELQHKFVVDVQDFMKDGEINVKAVDDRELVVEGLVEKKEGASKSIKKFSRRFLLPADVHLESVSSVMSSDGVLTIIAPKKNAISQSKESHNSFNTQKLENNCEVYEKVSDCKSQSSCDNEAYQKSCTMENKCCNSECDDRSIRASSTCSSAYDVSTQQQAGEDSTVNCSVTSNVFQSETSEDLNSNRGHGISIQVDDVDNEARDIRGRSHDDLMEDDIIKAEQRIMEEFYNEQRGLRGSSMDDLDSNLRSVRERSMDSRDMRSGSTRLEDMDEEDEDDVNFQDSSMHSEKKLKSILKTPDRYLREEDERNSRERSYAGEESIDGDGRRSPYRECNKKKLAPLNPDAKRVLPISVRGHFSSDAFFNDFQGNFKTAISDVLLKFNEKSSKTDDITAYRNMRLRDPKLENQAYHVQEDQGAHTVVLDVKDFINGDIEAAIYEENELVIEGRAERRTGTSITTLSFLRRFPLPEDVDTDAISVVMSSDGVLTVVTPWKGSSGLSAIKNILSTEDRSIFDRPSRFDRRWDDADWEDAQASDEFMNRSLDSRLRSRLRQATDDLF